MGIFILSINVNEIKLNLGIDNAIHIFLITAATTLPKTHKGPLVHSKDTISLRQEALKMQVLCIRADTVFSVGGGRRIRQGGESLPQRSSSKAS